MTQEGTIKSHLTPEITLRRILETSCRRGYSEIGKAAHQIILKGVWDDATNPTAELEMLDFAERIGNKELIGAAYYRVLCSGSASIEDGLFAGRELDASRLAKLEHGRKLLTLKWQELFEKWGVETASDESVWLQEVWIALAKGRFPLHDVVGRVKAAMKSIIDTSGGIFRYMMKHRALKAQLEEVKSSMYNFFTLPATKPSSCN